MPGAPPRIFDWGGRIQVLQIQLPPNSNFSLDFGHFILKILENLKFWCVFRIFSSKVVISGGTSPRILDRGDASPRPPPPAAAPMGRAPRFQLWGSCPHCTHGSYALACSFLFKATQIQDCGDEGVRAQRDSIACAAFEQSPTEPSVPECWRRPQGARLGEAAHFPLKELSLIASPRLCNCITKYLNKSGLNIFIATKPSVT